MKIAVLIPTIDERKRFLNHALFLIGEQTVSPDIIEIVNDERIYPIPDTAWRYKIGIERCKQKGADVIIFWEDDDWYHYKYIETILKEWILKGRPQVFGIYKTVYYHIIDGRYRFIEHPGRASMMSTMVTKDYIPNWEDQRDPYVDITIWKEMKNKNSLMDLNFNNPIAVGIKHGITPVAGGCHIDTERKLQVKDDNFQYLKRVVDADSFIFYNELRNAKR